MEDAVQKRTCRDGAIRVPRASSMAADRVQLVSDPALRIHVHRPSGPVKHEAQFRGSGFVAAGIELRMIGIAPDLLFIRCVVAIACLDCSACAGANCLSISLRPSLHQHRHPGPR